jgi:RNA polymerase sigma-70 factor (ECF subfamily)
VSAAARAQRAFTKPGLPVTNSAMAQDGRFRAIPGRDAGEFERLYDEHSSRLLTVAYRVLGDTALAQDVVQDVFLGMWRDPSRFDAGRGPIGHYLRMVTRSKALDVLRESQVAGRAKDRMLSFARAEEGPTELRPAAAAERHARSVVVRRALMRLPDVQREAIVLAYWAGMTAEQIAVNSRTPVGTVKSRIRLGVLKLREQCTPALADQPRAA